VGDEATEGVLTVKLADGTMVLVKITVVKVEEVGFSPYGGVMFNVLSTGQITYEWPDELKEKVKDKPFYYAWQALPRDGWELVDIEWQEPSVIETTVNSSRGTFTVRYTSWAQMAARNLNYRMPPGGPLYAVQVASETTWRPAGVTAGSRKGSMRSASPDGSANTRRVN